MSVKELIYLMVLSAAASILLTCNDEDGGGNACTSDFDQSTLFVNLADNIIVPAYEDLNVTTQELETEISAFTETGQNTAQLQTVRTLFTTAYQKWQKVAAYQFGPAEMQNLRPLLNSFPLDVDAVEQNISSQNYDLTDITAFDKGFPALDYLLYQPGASDQEIVTLFSVDPDAPKRQAYIKAIAVQIRERVELTLRGWKQEGYRDDFVSNTGTDAGSSLSLIINGLNEFYEDVRRDKIGTPSGIQDLGFTSPERVEAFYSGISLDLLEAALVSCEATFKGGSGTGLDDYLDALDAEKDGVALSQLIQERFTSSIAALAAIDGPLSDAVDNDAEDVRTAYTEISRQVIQLKTDMPSVMCVAITYIDNPSDSD